MKFMKQSKLLTFQVILSLIILNTQISFAQQVVNSQITNLKTFLLGANINNTSKKSKSDDLLGYNSLGRETYSDNDNNISLTLTKYFSNKDISDNFIYGFSVNVAHLKKFEGRDTSGALALGGNPITFQGNYINPELKVGSFLDEKKHFFINASYGKVFSDIKQRFRDDVTAGNTLSDNTSSSLEGTSKGIELAYNSESNIIYKLGLKNINFKREAIEGVEQRGGNRVPFADQLSLRTIYIGFDMPLTLDKIFK
jgi:hypothetical protein